jgi:hypothetical protein
MSSVHEIKEAIAGLTPAERAELNRWLQDAQSSMNPEADSPELEAELLKAVRGPHARFDEHELRSIADRALAEHRRRH